MTSRCPRLGFTLLELIVVIAIVAILFALLMVSVMRVREAAAIAQSKNNVRQILVGLHGYVASHQEQIPFVGDRPTVYRNGIGYRGQDAPALWISILPYLEGQAIASLEQGKRGTFGLFLSPADPTAVSAIAANAPVSSYAANGVLFKNDGRLSAICSDGTSTTIALAEHYAFNCNGMPFPYDQSDNAYPHRASFADIGDVVPVTHGNPPVSMPSKRPAAPVTTFQVAPREGECFAFVAQTPHSSGMVVGFADGSVRQLNPSISTSIFWGLVTPNRGESIALD